MASFPSCSYYKVMTFSDQTIEDASRDQPIDMRVEPPPRPPIDAATKRAARVFLDEIASRYPVIESLLYGSRARGDFRPDSDADIAVILKGARGDRAAVVQNFAAIAFHVMMDTGVMVEGLPLWEDEFAEPGMFGNPKLIENIRRDGLRF